MPAGRRAGRRGGSRHATVSNRAPTLLRDAGCCYVARMTTTSPSHTAGRFVGQKVLRKEDPRLLTGRGRYIDDITLQGHAARHFVRSDVARARITRLDVDAARDAEGVVAVLTAADLNDQVAVSMLPVDVPGRRRLHGADVPAGGRRRALRRRPDRAHRRREPLPRRGRRRAGRDRLRAARPGHRLRDRLAANAELVHPNRPGNVAMQMAVPTERRAARDVRRGRARVSPRPFVQHRYSMVPMECRGVVAQLGPVRRAARRVDLEPEPARGAPGVQPRHRRAREQRPRADRRRRRRLRPQVVRRARGDHDRDRGAPARRRRSSGSRTAARTSSRRRTRGRRRSTITIARRRRRR